MLTPDDDARVAAAIRAAEATTDAEIAVVVAPQSDTYADAVLHAALLLGLAPLALFATWPDLLLRLAAPFHGTWTEATPPLSTLLTLALAVCVLAFLVGRVLFGRFRFAVAPYFTKARRVRRRAITLFQVGIESRTASRTGALLYISLAEHRAELVVDETIYGQVDAREWGEAMAVLIAGLRTGRAGDGIVGAIERIGAVLASHLPHTGTDPNELPDRIIRI
jgi:putative membrane protein